ncbi:serine beta-lactamase-like protein lactb, mitochondrial-like [Plakobranchus ocellatus]|uniref:Serine beta-lactamase-like protein lactb, mitochondrial-like n=1 Tax=Plakobranchus ocellatus TaxID=259542 RepID=A0AAV4ABG3_9GAST|nr:serine beta-lactamase-like protein lactb, mitochondrial-like [Plakobranchus ocellatus]
MGRVVNAPYVDYSYTWAGAGFLSTAEDLVKFGNILLYSAQHEDGDLGPPGYLKASTVWRFWCPASDEVTPRYGLGFELTIDKPHYGFCAHHTYGAGHTGEWHKGHAIGASSVLFVLPRASTDTMDNKNLHIRPHECDAERNTEYEDLQSMKLKCGATLQNKRNVGGSGCSGVGSCGDYDGHGGGGGGDDWGHDGRGVNGRDDGRSLR